MFKKNRFHFLYFIIFLFILFIFTFPIIFKMNSAVYGPLYGTDNRAAIWHFWWFNYSFRNNLDVNTNVLTNYPFGVEEMGPKIFPICMISSYILSIFVNELFAYNFMILLSFILSFLTMYILVFYLTKSRSAAFVSGFIYSLCPYHVNKSWEHFGLMFIEFIPLYVYYLLKLKESPSLKNLMLCSLSLLLVLLSDSTYIFIVTIFSIFYLSFLLFNYFKGKRISFMHIENFLKMSVLTIAISFPLLFHSLKDLLSKQPGLISESPKLLVRPFHYLFSQSASILAYLVPSKFHPLWGGLARSLEGSIFFGRGSIEQTLYLGWVAIILSYLGFKKNKTHNISEESQQNSTKDLFEKNLFIFTLFASVIFSMPPYWNLLSFKVYFPSFFVYKVFPTFRAYARFGILATMSVSVLSGYGISYLLASKRAKKAIVALISLLVLIDFANIPPLRVTQVDSCPPVYKWLSNQKDFFAIAEYPFRLGDTSEGYENLDYLLYQRFHQKAILNGAKPGTRAYSIKQKLVKITDEDTPSILSSLGIRYVILHLEEYRQGNNKEAVDIVGEVPNLSDKKGFKLVEKFEDDEVYEVVALRQEIDI